MSQRLVQQSARRLALHQSTGTIRNAFAPAATLLLRRPTSTAASKAANLSQDEGYKILVEQRLRRPVSPHLTIYRPQITWYGSAANRITGAVLSGGFYIFGALYLVAPVLGLQISAASMAAGFAKWPVFLKVLTKLTIAFPFTYHSFNGLRHLIWDMGLTITNKQVIQTGWTAVVLAAVTAVGLAFY